MPETTPGPTPVPEETLLELAKPVFYHRSAQFRQLLAGKLNVLCALPARQLAVGRELKDALEHLTRLGAVAGLARESAQAGAGFDVRGISPYRAAVLKHRRLPASSTTA